MSTRATVQVSLLAAALLVLSVAGGCLRVVRQEAPYYRNGPHQLEPPDGFLPAGTHLLVFGEKDSYARMMTLKGAVGFIWSGDLVTPDEWRSMQKAYNADQDRRR